MDKDQICISCYKSYYCTAVVNKYGYIHREFRNLSILWLHFYRSECDFSNVQQCKIKINVYLLNVTLLISSICLFFDLSLSKKIYVNE